MKYNRNQKYDQWNNVSLIKKDKISTEKNMLLKYYFYFYKNLKIIK